MEGSGAVWSKLQDGWLIPASREQYPKVLKWVWAEVVVGIIACSPFYILETKRECYRCHELTTIVALGVRSGFEFADPNEYSVQGDYFEFFESNDLSVYSLDDFPMVIRPYIAKVYGATLNKANYPILSNRCQKCNHLFGQRTIYQTLMREQKHPITYWEIDADFDFAFFNEGPDEWASDDYRVTIKLDEVRKLPETIWRADSSIEFENFYNLDTGRIDLNVPYEEKDIAKTLGARWDPERKQWYLPPTVLDISVFSRWLQ